MPRFDVTAIGEVMLRLSVPVGARMERTRALDVHPGGAEGNVLAGLARLGRACAWGSALPDNALGRLIANEMRLAGIDLAGLLWRPAGRVGLYFAEFAAPPRNSDVIYDRADSCAAQLEPDDMPWDLLMDTRHFHVSGITPALSPAGLAATQRALREARARGVTISFDINYRAKMWSPAQARQALLPLLPGIDLLFCGQGDADAVFGCQGPPAAALRQLAALAQVGAVVMSAGDSGIRAWQQGEELQQDAQPVTIVDRLGAGDAMAAGVLHGFLDGDLAGGLRYGSLLAALALTQHGDMLVATQAEIESLLRTGGGGLAR